MIKFVVFLFSVLFFCTIAIAQPPASREQQELEKERQQLKR